MRSAGDANSDYGLVSDAGAACAGFHVARGSDSDLSCCEQAAESSTQSARRLRVGPGSKRSSMQRFAVQARDRRLAGSMLAVRRRQGCTFRGKLRLISRKAPPGTGRCLSPSSIPTRTRTTRRSSALILEPSSPQSFTSTQSSTVAALQLALAHLSVPYYSITITTINPRRITAYLGRIPSPNQTKQHHQDALFPADRRCSLRVPHVRSRRVGVSLVLCCL